MHKTSVYTLANGNI